jgi:hypothetical protein
MKHIFVFLLLVSLIIPQAVIASDEVELTHLRTQTSCTFLQPDGTYRAEISGGPINYWDNGWKPINNSIVNNVMSKDAYTFKVLQHTFNQGQIVEFDAGGQSVKFQPMALEWTNDHNMISQISMPIAVAGVTNNDPSSSLTNPDNAVGSIRWDGAYGAGTHFEWQTDAGVLRKTLELDRLPSIPQDIIDGGNPLLRLNFIFAPSAVDIYVDGQLWDQKAGNDKITFSQIEFRAGNQTVFYFVPAKCWDSKNNYISVQTQLSKSGKNLWVSTLVPYSWLQRAVYPVYIDPTISPYSSASDGYIYASSATYATAWGATTGTVADGGAGVNIGQTKIVTTYYLYRTFFFFDTSAVVGTITAASLHLYGTTDGSDTDFLVTIQKGDTSDYPHDGLQTGDYNRLNYNDSEPPNDGGQQTTVGFTTSGYNTITIDDFDFINAGGATKLCVRSGREISGTTPGGDEYVAVYATEETGTSKDPYLSVSYAGLPTIETDACSDYTYNSFSGNGDITSDGGGTLSRRGFYYTTVFDDFEWGSDGDPLSDSGGAIGWTISVAGTSKVEIDDAVGIPYSGTRCARFYRDGTNNARAIFGQSAVSASQVIGVRFRKDDTSQIYIIHGDGSQRITIYIDANEHIWYNDGTAHDTGAAISAGSWYHLTVPNVNWPAHTYDIYLNGVLIKSAAGMDSAATYQDQIVCANTAGTSEVWLDEVGVWEVEDESGSFSEGAYDLSITGLDSATTYYVMAFAENEIGISYGDVVTALTCPAAPTNVAATDGVHTDKVVITWTKSMGATGYKVYEGSNLLDTLGDVDTYDDTAAPAPTITPGSTVASDGSSTAQVELSLDGTGTNNGASRTYKVKALNGSGDSPDSSTDTGYRGVGALSYQWQRSSGDADADYSNIDGATSSTYNDVDAPAPTITPGTAAATDGTSPDHVGLSIGGQSANVGDGRYYQCILNADGAVQQISSSNRGYRDVGSLTYQWQVSLGDSDDNYSNIGGATTASYDYTGAGVPSVTAGTATASDGTSPTVVTLQLTGQHGNNGAANYYHCTLTATGAASQNSTANRGYRGISTLTFQWMRSLADSNANYSNILGGTTNPYNDAGGVVHPDGRYYQCLVGMLNATSVNSTYDRGFLANVPPGPLNLTATQLTADSISLNWTATSNYTVIYVSTSDFPAGVGDGTLAYNGTGESVIITGLALDATTYYYRAWSWNGMFYSTDYDEVQIGGSTMIFISFVLMAMGMMTLFVWKRIGLFSFGAAGVWALLAFLGFQQSGAGAPIPITDVYMGVFWIGVAFTIICAFLPMIMREKPDPDDVYIDDFDEVTGQLTGRHKRGDKPQDEPLKRKKPIPSSFSMTGK